MSGTATERLAALRTLVEQAKGVPMSASAMLNRGDVLAIIDEIRGALADELAEAQRLVGESDARIVAAEERAAGVLAEAEQQARALVGQEPVRVQAEAEAAQLLADARAEGAALRQEADRFVDARIAELEAGLARTVSSLDTTMGQIRTMRARLSERSHLDDPAPLE